MGYSTEQIEKIKELAACLTPVSDMAVLLDVDVDALRLDRVGRHPYGRFPP